MEVGLGTKLGTFPVTQQLVGIGTIVVGLAITIAALAARIFVEIKLWNANRELSNSNSSDVEVSKLNSDANEIVDILKKGLKGIVFGLLTATPLVGTVIHGLKWNSDCTPPVRVGDPGYQYIFASIANEGRYHNIISNKVLEISTWGNFS